MSKNSKKESSIITFFNELVRLSKPFGFILTLTGVIVSFLDYFGIFGINVGIKLEYVFYAVASLMVLLLTLNVSRNASQLPRSTISIQIISIIFISVFFVFAHFTLFSPHTEKLATPIPLVMENSFGFEDGGKGTWEKAKGESSAEEVNVSTNYAHSGERSLQVSVKGEQTYPEGGNYGSVVIDNMPYNELKAISAWVYIPEDSVEGGSPIVQIGAEAIAEHYDDEDKITREIPFPAASSAVKIEPGNWTQVFWSTSFTIWKPEDFHIDTFENKFTKDYPLKLSYPLEWQGKVNTVELAIRNFYKPIEGKAYIDDIKFYT